MKRFFIIFAICFASIIGVFAGVFGIKYLKGDFNQDIINPESIAFELEEYDVTGDFQIKITTTTENVTATKVELSFSKGTTYYTYNSKNFITDGVIIIPKQVTLNVPFEVKVFTTNDDELGGINWIKGGISNLVATSENITTKEATTKVCVDVPVYKSEIVLFDSEGEIDTNNITNVLGAIENQTGLIKQGNDISFNAGDTFYLGLKYFPQRSAFKYSKINSTNLFIEYKDQIIAKLSQLNLDYSDKLNVLNNLFTDSNSSKHVNFQEIIDSYLQIINLNNEKEGAIAQFTQYLINLNNEFENNLKYYVYEESPNNGRTFTTKLNRITGTNLYKIQATTDSSSFTNKVNVNLYSYTFSNSAIEADTRAVYTDETMLLNKLEDLSKYSESKVVDKNEKNFNIVDVDVDTINITGMISDFNTNKIHNIFASKNGDNNSDISYLNIKLSNSNISSVNLQDKILKTGIRFEKRLGTNEWGNATEIKFVDSDKYTQILYNGNIYFLPIGTKSNYTNAYWQIYSDEYISNDIRLVLAYFKTYDLNDDQKLEASNAMVVESNKIFRLNNSITNEQMVSWTSLDNLKLGAVNMSGAIDMSAPNVNNNEAETTKDVKYNKEIDLTKLINIPTTNNFQVYKFFLFSNDEEATNKISKYFNTKDNDSKEYTFNGITQKLYELDGNILKLKNEDIPSYSINVMFATIETDAMRNPILKDGKYSLVKYSAVKDSLVENLSSLTLEFSNSISTLKGSVTINNINAAGVSNEAEPQFKIAQNTNNVLKVTITDKNGDVSDNIKNAILNGSLKIEARTKKNEATNYISCKSFIEANTYGFDITSLAVDKDVIIRLYFVYTIDGNDYLFPIQFEINNKTYYVGTIIKETNSKAYFNFTDENGEYINNADIQQISVTTKYENYNFAKTYVASLNDGTIKENIQLFENNKLKIRIINFLGNEVETDEWYLISSNNNIITIQDNQIINFVGNSDKPITISLYLGTNNNGDLCEQVNFIVSTPGYVESVMVDSREVYSYDQDTQVKYTFPKQNVLKTINKGASLSLRTLLNIGYKIPSVDTPIDLPLKIYIANETTLNALKTITSNNSLNLNDEINDIDLKLTKDLGDIVSLDLIYKCEDLSIIQTVNLKLNQTIKVKNLKITDNSGAEVKINSTIYDIYAGVPYDINIENDETLYWYKDGETLNTVITDKKFSIIYNDSISGKQKIHITNVNSTEPNVGDLNYVIIFNIQKNIDIKKDANSTISLTENKITINLSNLLERKTNSKPNMSLEENSLQGNLSLQFKDITNYNYAEDNKYIDETQSNISKNELQLAFKSFNNKANIKFWIVCDDVNLVYVSLTIVPEDLRNIDNHFALYKNQKSIIVYNTEIISSDNDKTNIFTSMFASGAEVICDNDFYTTYTTKDGTKRQVTQSSTTELFTNTNTYVTVTKDGISSTYLIVISKLVFPFVTFKDNNGQELSYKNLDIFKLFIDTENLYDYYKSNNIPFFTTSEDKILTLVGDDGIYSNKNLANFTDIGFIEMAKSDNGIATDYASLNSVGSTINLMSNEIGVDGGVYLRVFIRLALANTSSFVSIPIIVYLPQSQRLQVNYPNSGVSIGKDDETYRDYGTNDYDNTKLTQTISPFETGAELNEYLSFETNGQASLILFGDKYTRFNILKLIGNNWSEDSNQNLDSLTYTIEKVAINLGNKWSIIDDNSKFVDYANISVINNSVKLTLYKNNGVSIIRVKLKISTSSGAVNYYYVSAGDATPLTIMRKSSDSSTALTVGIKDNIIVNSLESILIGASEQASEYKYYYYLSNSSYANELKFRIVSNNQTIELDEINEFIENENGYIKIKVQPMGAEFQIELYTIYGVISTIDVKVNPAYTISLNTELVNNLYSGTEYKISDLFNITTNVANLTKDFALKGNSEPNNYYSCDANKVIFKHIDGKYANFDLEVALLIGGEYEYTFKQFITLNQRIISNYSQQSPYDETNDLTTYIIDGENILLDKGIITELFYDLSLKANINTDTLTNIKYLISYNGISEPIEIDNIKDSGTITLKYGVIIASQNVTIKVEIKSNDNNIIIATAYARLTINPKYIVEINYPYTSVGTLTSEYVQVGATIDFNGKNFNDLKRINVKETKTDKEINFTIKLSDGSTCENNKIDNIAKPNNSDGLVEFGIYIDDIKYAIYRISVSEDSPFTFTPDENLIVYVGCGDNDVYGYVDVVVTLPYINTLAQNSKISLWVKNNNDFSLIKNNVYYNNAEKIRCVLDIEKYQEGLTEVYLQVEDATSSKYKCDAIFTTRCNLKYYNEPVNYADYKNIISTLNISDKSISENGIATLNIEDLKLNCSIATSPLSGKFTINYAYDVQLLNKDNEIILNANEYQDGLSFVELFNLQDKLNNIFGYNQLNNAKISVSLGKNNDSSVGNIINCLLITPQLEKINDNIVTIDYLLKAVGAANKGSQVKLTFIYSVEGRTDSYSAELNITIKTDVKHEVYNNDGTATPNSKLNPLRLSSPAKDSMLTFVLSSLKQKNYIYAYGIYSKADPKLNLIASWSEPEISGDTNYFLIEKVDGELKLTYKHAAFGNKTLTIRFTDPYGYTFNYYIELVAEISVNSYSLDSGKFFEGGQLDVYNRNKKDDASKKGVGLYLIKNGSIDVDTSFTIVDVAFRYKDTNISYSTDNENNPVILQSGIIMLKFMNMGGRSSINGTLEIWIKLDSSSDETYFMEVDFVLYKRYSIEIATENTYVRESIPINLAHYIDVYDYKQEAYLGTPELNKYEQASASVDLSEIKIETNNNLFNIIKDQVIKFNNADNDATPEKTAESIREDVWNELKKYGITQYSDLKDNKLTISNLGIYINIKAIHKTSLASIIKQSYVNMVGIEDSDGNTTDGKIKIREILGTETSTFGPSVTSQNYDFEMYLCNISTGASTIKIAATKNEDGINTAATGYTHRLAITVSERLIGTINIGLLVDGEFKKYSVSTNFNNYLEEYDNKSVELFTGKQNDTPYINGLTVDDVLKARNINKEESIGGLEKTPELFGESFITDEKYNIKYQDSLLSNVEIYFSEYKVNDDISKNAKSEVSGNLRVTTKYTGIDTTLAYSSGSVHYCYDLDYDVDAEGKITGENNTVSLEKWSNGFKLIPGIGISAIMAQNDDVTFYGINDGKKNVDSLIFEPANVIANGGETLSANKLVTIANDGKITLEPEFKPNDYYIGINVYCTYGDANNKKVLLNTIYVAFVDTDVVDMYSVGDNNFDLDINKYAGDKTSVNDVQLGLYSPIKFDSSNKKATFSITNKSEIDGKVFILKVGDTTRYVSIRIHVLEISNSINITKQVDENNNFNYIITTNDVILKYDNDAIKSGTEFSTNGVTLTYKEITDESGVKKYFSCGSALSSGEYLFYYKNCACKVTLTIN